MSRFGVRLSFIATLTILISLVACFPSFASHHHDEDEFEFFSRQLVVGVSIFVIVIIGALLICNVSTCRDAFKYIFLTAAAFSVVSGLVFVIVFLVSSIASEVDN